MHRAFTAPGEHPTLCRLWWTSDTYPPLTVPQSTQVRSNLTRRFAPSPHGGGAEQQPTNPHRRVSEPLNKRLKDERSTIFALLVPPLCAITLVFTSSQRSHFSYMRYDVYTYVL